MPPKLSASGRRLDLAIRQGASFGPFRFRFNAQKTGAAIDFTGAQVRAPIRRGHAAPEAEMEIILYPDGFSIALTPDQSAAITSPRLSWGIEIEWSNGHVDTPFFGEVVVERLLA
jgi:hypothetical protein